MGNFWIWRNMCRWLYIDSYLSDTYIICIYIYIYIYIYMLYIQYIYCICWYIICVACIEQATIPGKIFGTKFRNPVIIDRKKWLGIHFCMLFDCYIQSCISWRDWALRPILHPNLRLFKYFLTFQDLKT